MTKKDLENTLAYLAHNWLNGEISDDDFHGQLSGYCENNLFAAAFIGAWLQRNAGTDFKTFLNSFDNY